MKKKIGLDFDGVIANSNEIKIKLIVEMYGIKLPLSAAKEGLAVSLGIVTAEQYNNAAIRLYNTTSTLEAKPVEGVIESIAILNKFYDVSVVTSRMEKSVELVKQWCVNNGLKDLPIVGTNRQPKTPFLEGFFAFVDDDPEKLRPLIGVVENPFLYTWEYNKDEVIPNEIKRVKSWSELIASIESTRHC